MNLLTLLGLIALVLWWYRPLREFLIQRTNRTVKVLLIVLPLVAAARVGYSIYANWGGEQDLSDVMAVIVALLLILWGALIWLGNWLERRRPTQARAPNLAALSRLPGMPRVPAAVTSPQTQQVARAAMQAAARVDWDNVAVSVGRSSGRFVARLRKSLNSK